MICDQQSIYPTTEPSHYNNTHCTCDVILNYSNIFLVCPNPILSPHALCETFKSINLRTQIPKMLRQAGKQCCNHDILRIRSVLRQVLLNYRVKKTAAYFGISPRSLAADRSFQRCQLLGTRLLGEISL